MTVEALFEKPLLLRLTFENLVDGGRKSRHAGRLDLRVLNGPPNVDAQQFLSRPLPKI